VEGIDEIERGLEKSACKPVEQEENLAGRGLDTKSEMSGYANARFLCDRVGNSEGGYPTLKMLC
jgi:hypothetical protein